MDPESDKTQQQAYSSDYQVPELESTPGLILIPQDSPPENVPPYSVNWKSRLLPLGGLVGLAAVFFFFMIPNNHRSTAKEQVTESTSTTPGFFVTPRSSLTLPLASEAVTTEEAYSIPLKSSGNLAYVSFIDGEVFQSINGNAILLNLNDSLGSPSSLSSNPDSGAYIELPDSNESASFLYLFFESTMDLVYDTAFHPQLPDGRLYLQTGLEEAAIHFPNHHNTVAILAGSTDIENPNRMLVEILDADIWIWCLSGNCAVENEQGEQTTLPPMTKGLYHPETGDIEGAIPITTEELWAWQAACAYRCLTGFAVFPIPTITTTAAPTIFHTAIPPMTTIDHTPTTPTTTPTATPTATTTTTPTAIPTTTPTATTTTTPTTIPTTTPTPVNDPYPTPTVTNEPYPTPTATDDPYPAPPTPTSQPYP